MPSGFYLKTYIALALLQTIANLAAGRKLAFKPLNGDVFGQDKIRSGRFTYGW